MMGIKSLVRCSPCEASSRRAFDDHRLSPATLRRPCYTRAPAVTPSPSPPRHGTHNDGPNMVAHRAGMTG